MVARPPILQNVTNGNSVIWLESGTYVPNLEISGDVLMDLEVIPSQPGNFRLSPLTLLASSNSIAIEPETTPVYIDPAILSVGKPSLKTLKQSDTIVSAKLKEPLSNLTINPSGPKTSQLGSTELASISAMKQVTPQTKSVSSPVQQAFQDLIARSLHIVKNGPILKAQHEEIIAINGLNANEQLLAMIKPKDPKPAKMRGRKTVNQINGELSVAQDSMPRKPKKSSTRKHKPRISEAQNGWATEEATDIQDLGEFDFAANLSKFDKREVFKQLKENDMIAAGDRLVGHNRLPKSGTSGSRNLHWTENVLDSPVHDSHLWNSEAGETADDLENMQDSGRSSTRQNSNSRSRLIAQRKGGHTMEDQVRRDSQITITQNSFEGTTGTPRISARKKYGTPYTGNPSAKGVLRIIGSNKICPYVSPLQMLELEYNAIADLGLNEDILTENAARGIAEIAIKMHSEEEQTPILARDARILMICGSHKTGARALAAARHLHNRGYKTTVAMIGREEDFLEMVRQQMNAFIKTGGEIIKPTELLAAFKGTLKPSLLIDALTGMHISLEDLRREDQQWCFELAILTQRLKTKLLSVDVPSGLDPSTASVALADGEPVAFPPDTIIALGAPKPYLLSWLGHTFPPPKLYVVDLSLGRSAWKRMGGKRKTGVDFGDKWLVELELQISGEVVG